ARLGTRHRETKPVHDVVEPALQEAEHLFARSPLPTRRVEVVVAELALEHAVDPSNLLLFAKADRVLAELYAPLAVLARRVRPARVRALFRVAALPFEKELHSLTAAELAHRTNVTCHYFSPFVAAH